MTAKRMVRVWLMNHWDGPRDKLHDVAYQKGYMSRYYNTAIPVEVGEPMPTAERTVEELKADGIVGLYGWKFVRPIERKHWGQP